VVIPKLDFGFLEDKRRKTETAGKKLLKDDITKEEKLKFMLA